MSLQDSNLARSLMNLVEILMKDISAEDNKYMKSWLIVSLFVLSQLMTGVLSSDTMAIAVY